MNELIREDKLTLAAVAQMHPSNVHIETVRRWCLRGVGGVKLESFKEGGERLTTVQAYERFILRLNGEDL